jgi:hypothetical protein
MSKLIKTTVSLIQAAVIGYVAKLKIPIDVRYLIIIVCSNNAQEYWTHLL